MSTAAILRGRRAWPGPLAIVFAVACVIAYSTSGHKGIYHAQPVAAHKSGVRGNP